ncbi:hypothetical protein [Aurantivibrio infirmus]
MKTLIKTVSASATALCFGIGLTVVSTAATAQTIEVPIGQQAQQNQNLKRPRAGTTKTNVEQNFGAPIEVRPAVGEPPISSWVYADFIVYFEYDHVIHTVLKATPRN